MIIGTYVDDLIIAGSNKQVIAQFKEEMHQKFEMSDLGLRYDKVVNQSLYVRPDMQEKS